MFGEFISILQKNLESLLGDGKPNLKELENKVINQLPAELQDNVEYVQNVILQSVRFIQSATDELTLPMINISFTKENALPRFLWGMLWKDWEKQPEDGTTVFLQDYRDRGLHNAKKKAYFSALTPDLYEEKYQPKIKDFFNKMLGRENSNIPLMDQYVSDYLDLYWNLHLNVKPQDIPEYAKQIGKEFINCLAIVTPFDPNNLSQSLDFKRSYEYVRRNRSHLSEWLASLIDNVKKNQNEYKDTFVYYWFVNNQKGNGAFTKEDITFECFHNFLALSQWGNTIYNMMDLLREDNEKELACKVQTEFKELMSSNPNELARAGDDNSFTRLDFFVFELMRVILPNNGSISRVALNGQLANEPDILNFHLHQPIGNSSLHWSDARLEKDSNDNNVWVAPFNPERYQDVPLSHTIDEEGLKKAAALNRCPFEQSSITTKDGRSILNNAYGTTYSSNEKAQCPVIETAGYSPFGFGYRRCPGELFTANVFKTFLKTVWENQISFYQLDSKDPQEIPVAPATFVKDNIAMKYSQ
ncbi:hypothetical protein H0A36_00570 [Endozoicomonas sp. SM1973]|uniref:Cytochrome P450 n=1 Tax=Spartinivicinus marinus TaxID=2994442 RepID=A0A853I153_9GAMM|nr:hypothetical protein [Spartinivicinus marinus]MCX4026644.1 hypothetical protein [Spartinivicinus marinus]NYZ64478.1 hypothetical protein [Spartinivicinus marinus]